MTKAILLLLCFSLSGCVAAGYHQRKTKTAWDDGYSRGWDDALYKTGRKVHEPLR